MQQSPDDQQSYYLSSRIVSGNSVDRIIDVEWDSEGNEIILGTTQSDNLNMKNSNRSI